MNKIAELPNEGEFSDSSKTFVFQDEGHTIGNVLKSIIGRYPEVNFCGYTVPHPGESILHLRIQTSKGKAIDALVKGLTDLEQICDHTIETFKEAIQDVEDK